MEMVLIYAPGLSGEMGHPGVGWFQKKPGTSRYAAPFPGFGFTTANVFEIFFTTANERERNCSRI